MLEDEPADPAALKALDVLYRDLERLRRLRRRSCASASSSTSTRPSSSTSSSGSVARSRSISSDPASALENYREILFLEPGHDGAREALEALLDNTKLRAEAASILEGIYEVRGDWQKLVRALEILARVRRRRRAARRAAAQGRADRGRCARRREPRLRSAGQGAQGRSRRIAESRVELERLAGEANAWDKLDAIFDEIAEGLADAALARDYWMRLAHIDERLGKVDEAAKGYVHILSQNPADAEALEALDSLYRAHRAVERSHRRLPPSHRARPAKSRAREALYAQMAEVYEEQLGSPDDAIASYKRGPRARRHAARSRSPRSTRSTRARRCGSISPRTSSRSSGSRPTDEAQLALMLRLAVAPRARDGPGRRSDRRLPPRFSSAIRTNANALAALERLGRAAPHELAIAEILEPLYRQVGDFQKLIGVHEVQVRRADDAARKVELLHQIAQLYEDAAGDLNAAFDTYARALREDPASEVTQQGLDRFARATGRFADLATGLRRARRRARRRPDSRARSTR